MLTALVLGAGLSERMGEEKLLLPLGNQTLLERTLSSIRNGFSGVIVVITKEKIYKAVKKNDSFYYRINKYPEKGQAFSLMLGVREIMKRCPESDGILVFLADNPLVKKVCIRAVKQMIEQHPDKIIVPEYKGKPGHPVAFGKRWFRALTQISGDQGGRSLIKKYPESVIRIQCDSSCTFDIDTREDYERALEKRMY